MTLTPEQIADGYLPHPGGPCPVPLDSKPGVIFAHGGVLYAGKHSARFWAGGDFDWWQHESNDPAYHIIAYKPEPTT